MSLPAKALEILADLKKELLSREELHAEPAPEEEQPKREEKPTQTMRHARRRNEGFQRYCRRRGW